MKYIFFILLLSLYSCAHEESTYTKSILKNNTSHSLAFVPYAQGIIVRGDSVHIEGHQQKSVLEKTTRGKGKGLIYSDYIAVYDSLIIYFDDTIQALHYSYGINGIASNPTAVSYDSSRSIFNESNYARIITAEHKSSISNEYTFEISEQDYLDAKGNYPY